MNLKGHKRGFRFNAINTSVSCEYDMKKQNNTAVKLRTEKLGD